MKVQENRPLLQALLVRLYPRKVRLMKENDTVVARRVKGSPGSLSASERRIIRENSYELARMLDPRLAHRLLLDVRQQLASSYPLGRGVDISEAQSLVDTASKLLGNYDIHGCWFYLDRALHLGLSACRDGYKQPLLGG
jgi:hypothetical protein